MKYYFLTHDDRQDFVAPPLYELLASTVEVTESAWREAGGARLSVETPPTQLWGARPGHLLIDAGLRPEWVTRFGDHGVLDTALGTRDMFTVVPAGDQGAVAPPGDWRQYHYFATKLWSQAKQPYALAARFDLRDPVVRPWDSTGALETLYSEEVVGWLREKRATGVSFSLVWDPDRTALPPITEHHDHQCVVL